MTEETRPSITCPLCGMRSFHPDDVRERYCGRCNLFHDSAEFRRRLAEKEREQWIPPTS